MCRDAVLAKSASAWLPATHCHVSISAYHWDKLLKSTISSPALFHFVKEVTRDDFPLPTLAPTLEAIRQSVLFGRGFQLIRGETGWQYSRVLTQARSLPCCASPPACLTASLVPLPNKLCWASMTSRLPRGPPVPAGGHPGVLGHQPVLVRSPTSDGECMLWTASERANSKPLATSVQLCLSLPPELALILHSS